MKYLGKIQDDKDLVTKEYVDDASEVIQTLTSGTKIGSVGGTDLYAPSGGGGTGSQTTWYGTSSTQASAAAKVVSCSGFTLTDGAIIGITFSYSNTADVPTLNVNNTGAKSILVGTTIVNGTSNVLKWSANTVLYFQYYDGYWYYIASSAAGSTTAPRGANTWYGTCSTAADTAAKVVSCSNFVLTQGAVITVRFSNGISSTSSTTLNVNNTGAKTIERKYTGVGSTLCCKTNSQLTFMYYSSYWELISVDDQEHPIGSCYTTSTNTNPSTYFGGTWELIHKSFTSAWISDAMTFDTTNTTDGASVFVLNGNTVEVRITWKNKVAISDNDIQIGTINMEKIGASAAWHMMYPVAYNDGCNAIGMAHVNLSTFSTATPVGVYDWVTRATSYPNTTGQGCYLNFTINVRYNVMADDMCDEFVWKRTA